MSEVLSREERQKIVKEFLKDKNMRLVRVRTPDGHTAVNVLQQLDRFAGIARNRMLQPGYDPEQILGLLKRYRETIAVLNEIAESLSEIVNIEYKKPAMFREDDNNKEAGE